MSSSQDPSSPFNYTPSQTALLLLDFQNFTIEICSSAGQGALAKATGLRQWALSEGVMVVHSIVDVNATPPQHTKGAERIKTMLAGIKENPESGKVPKTLQATEGNEYVVLKWPGVVSGLKSEGCEKLLRDKGIKSLIICGLSTSGAVLRTTTAATDDGYVATVIRDACGDRTAGLHEMLMEKVLPSRAHVLALEEFVEEWKKANGGSA